MNRKYEEVMDKIQVTPEMRGRILSNIEKMEFQKEAPAFKPSLFRRYLPFAACLALLMAAAFALPRLAGPNPPDTVMTTPDITEVSSSGELEALVGFEIEKVDLPFDVEAVTYTSYWRELAQVTYTGEGQTAVFRKTLGSADPSGDYNIYADERALETDGISANLKGKDGLYTLAVWSDGEYSYSLDITDGLTEDAWLELINSIK